jgi:hypothetical protein
MISGCSVTLRISRMVEVRTVSILRANLVFMPFPFKGLRIPPGNGSTPMPVE